MTIPETVRSRIHSQAQEQCGYCRVPSAWVYAPMHIDHIIPKAAGGTDDESNLWLSCPRCNMYKDIHTYGIDPITQEQATLFNPRTQQWHEHFSYDVDRATIIGKTATGHATVEILRMNLKPSVELRRALTVLGVYPPD